MGRLRRIFSDIMLDALEAIGLLHAIIGGEKAEFVEESEI